MTRRSRLACALVVGCAMTGARRTDDASHDASAAASTMPATTRLGGPATVAVDGSHAFSLPIPGLSREDRRAFSVGNSFFRDNWIAAPASAAGRDGLGPLFNANSCSACHADDGRGRPPEAGERGTGLVVFASPHDADGASHPVYGHQLQDQAVDGVRPEVAIALVPRTVRGAYGDGTPYELADWRIELADAAYGPLGALRLSPRIGQQIVGVGLLEAVDDGEILAREDAGDRDGDGISGRAHRVTGADGTRGVGRFGWKATQPTLEAQVIAALHEDICITSGARPGEALSAAERAAVTAPRAASRRSTTTRSRGSRTTAASSRCPRNARATTTPGAPRSAAARRSSRRPAAPPATRRRSEPAAARRSNSSARSSSIRSPISSSTTWATASPTTAATATRPAANGARRPSGASDSSRR